MDQESEEERVEAQPRVGGRKYPRLRTNIISYAIKSDPQAAESLKEVLLKDISKGGVYIESDEPFNPGDFIILDIMLPGDEQTAASVISISGVVRWRKEGDPTGLGIEFTRITDDDAKKLDNYLEFRLEDASESQEGDTEGQSEAGRRKFPRLCPNIVSYLIKTDPNAPDVLKEIMLKDISRGGVYVESEERFETGDFVVLELTLPGDGFVVSSVISVSGMVKWCKGGNPYGLGVEILRISDNDKERLDTYLDYYAGEDEIGVSLE